MVSDPSQGVTPYELFQEFKSLNSDFQPSD